MISSIQIGHFLEILKVIILRNSESIGKSEKLRVKNSHRSVGLITHCGWRLVARFTPFIASFDC